MKLKNKKCRWTKCEKRAKKRIALTIKGKDTSTIRVVRFCSISHFNLYKAQIFKHNTEVRQREFENEALRYKTL